MNRLGAIKLSRSQLQLRIAQLASCRTCGAEKEKYEAAVAELDILIKELGGHITMFQFGTRSTQLLGNVNGDLQRVARRAIQLSQVDFAVVQGNRTLDEQKRLYGKGRTSSQCTAKGVPSAYARPSEAKVTWTLLSNHIGGNAIDVAPYVNGKLEWDNDGKLGLWPQIAAAFKTAAAELNVNIQWGGDWVNTVDRPHFELVR